MPTGPSVLVITLDTTRADRLGPYGYALADTPTYDRLADEGTVFERAYSACPLTIPSHATIFTGRSPPSHGVRDDGDFVLGPAEVTLAERFRDAGYQTAAFTSAFTTQARWGFSQGFEVYHDSRDGGSSRGSRGAQRPADAVVDDALQTLSTLPGGPVFSWVHLYDAHWPYDPPERYLSKHTGRPYDGEIAFVDAEVGRLLSGWEAAYPDSIIVVTADHGEALGEGGEQTHGILLHDGTLHVPLILKGPGVAVGARVAAAVGHTDLAPTLLQLAGLSLHEGLQGRDLREGGSDLVYSEALTGQLGLALAPMVGWTDEGGRYTQGAWDAFYPVDATDSIPWTPGEGFERGSPNLEPLAKRLGQLRAALDEGSAPLASLDAESLEILSALGYVGGDPWSGVGGVDPRDVMEVIPLMSQTRRLIGLGMYRRAEGLLGRLRHRVPGGFGVELLAAQLAQQRGDTEGAVAAYTDLYMRSPTSTMALQLASVYATVGDWKTAEDWYREALDLHPGSPEARAGLVRALYAQDRGGLAEEVAHRFLIFSEEHAELQLMRAEVALRSGIPRNGLVDARTARDAMPHSPWAHAVTGQILWELGESGEAIEHLQEALRIHPYDATVRKVLSACLLDVGRSAESVRILAPLARLMPEDEDIQTRYEAAREALSLERRGESHPKTSDLSRGG